VEQVVSQERFGAHWEHCEGFDYGRVQERSPTDQGGGSTQAGATGALKLKIGLTKQGQMKAAGGGLPTKFVSGKNPAIAPGQLSKKRKGEEMEYVDAHAGHIEIEVITCDGCGMSPIYSSRYSCNQCLDYDLCQTCYIKGPANHLGHDPTHDFCLLAIPVVSSGTGGAPGQGPTCMLGSDLLGNSHFGAAGRAGIAGEGKLKKNLQMDLDRICGVTLETGHRCMRTIDCKAHTQLAKREVLGRSRPYDELLAERKALKASQQQAALNAQAGAAPMHLRPGKSKHERSEEEEADARAFYAHNGLDTSGDYGWAADAELACFAGVWGANGLPVPGRLPLLEHLALRSTSRVDASGGGGGGGGVEGSRVYVAEAGAGGGGGGMFGAGGGLEGCPLAVPFAVPFVARSQNSLFSLMWRKQSTEVVNPPPPEQPFLGLYSKHAIAHLADEPRSRAGGGKKATHSKGDETVSTPTTAPPGKKGGGWGTESGTPSSTPSKGKGGGGGAAQSAAAGMWPPGEKPPAKKKAKSTKAQQAAAGAGVAGGTAGVGPGAMQQAGPAAALGAMPGAPAAGGKGKGKAKAVGNGKPASATGQGWQGVAGALPGQVPGTAPAGQRLGYGPKMAGNNKQLMAGNKQAAQAQANAAARAAGVAQVQAGAAMAPRPGAGQAGMKQGAGAPPGQGGPGGAAPTPASGAAGAPPQPAPIRVRQAFRWAYNLRKKPIDKSRVRKS
jgi:hypothetical protein